MKETKTNIVFNAGPIHNQSAGIHVWTKEILKALHDLKLNGQMPEHLHWILFTEKPTDDYPLFEVKTIPVYPNIPGFASLRLFIVFPIIAMLKKATWFIEPAHFGPFNLPRRIKRITVIHDLTPILFPQWHNFNSRFLQKTFLPQILKKANLIITVSQNSQSDIEKYLPKTKGKIKVIYPGISPNFTPKPTPLHNTPYILYTGTIEPRKNLVTLIKAFERLKARQNYTHYRLLLIGKKGWKTQAFDQVLESSPCADSIEIKGYVPLNELVEAYSGCSVFVYPSLYEGFGFPVLEAMSCGAKVITCEHSSLGEIANQHAFLLKNPHDPMELAELMDRAIQSPNNPKAIEYAKGYQWEKAAMAWLDLFNILPTEKLRH